MMLKTNFGPFLDRRDIMTYMSGTIFLWYGPYKDMDRPQMHEWFLTILRLLLISS